MNKTTDSKMRLPMIAAVTFAMLTASIVNSPAAFADNHADSVRGPSITVSGTGEVSADPDLAMVNVGVVSEAKTAKEALVANNEAMRNLFAQLDKLGIDQRDRQTAHFNVSPQYDHQRPQPGRSVDPNKPRIIGYQVTNDVRVKVREISRVGEILDAVVQGGSNRINGISFSVEDDEAAMREARVKAVKDAQAKAKLLCETAGAELGNVIEIHEAGAGPSPRRPEMMMMAQARSVPVAPGEQTISASVTMTFQIKAE
ncbi:SIMPL domain-containing protein [Roseiconus lacunae]|uniref:SIMPL domain-containing protein n=1 Tax=Roseiconus lacunae TaxID=2605694 RepID=A0ABT7PSF0_9BACT|nr:SIMPL domain-containing protein [Roseiconus lacunae]MDM4019036.1 SIMPL domain-containing protein [Roseiconus lacunae]